MATLVDLIGAPVTANVAASVIVLVAVVEEYVGASMTIARCNAKAVFCPNWTVRARSKSTSTASALAKPVWAAPVKRNPLTGVLEVATGWLTSKLAAGASEVILIPIRSLAGSIVIKYGLTSPRKRIVLTAPN